jgi:ATP-dependent DNA ligase
MPFTRHEPEPGAPIAPADWRPQAIGRKPARNVPDPIIEPGWSGQRVLARAGLRPDGTGYATLTDDQGVDCTAEFEPVAAAIAQACLADELVLDGWLSVEPTQRSLGVTMNVVEPQTSGQVFGQMLGAGGKVRETPVRPLDPDRPIAFVAVDLLLIDGTVLIDLPLLERKRLLDGALRSGELTRITPYVRPPIGSLAVTWRSLGFSEMVYKPANGRYLPTGEPSDWAVALITIR